MEQGGGGNRTKPRSVLLKAKKTARSLAARAARRALPPPRKRAPLAFCNLHNPLVRDYLTVKLQELARARQRVHVEDKGSEPSSPRYASVKSSSDSSSDSSEMSFDGSLMEGDDASKKNEIET